MAQIQNKQLLQEFVNAVNNMLVEKIGITRPNFLRLGVEMCSDILSVEYKHAIDDVFTGGFVSLDDFDNHVKDIDSVEVEILPSVTLDKIFTIARNVPNTYNNGKEFFETDEEAPSSFKMCVKISEMKKFIKKYNK